MEENSNTAEHELLKAIEGQNPAVPPRNRVPAASMEKLFNHLAGRVAEWLKRGSLEKIKAKVGLHEINRALIVIVLIFVLWYLSVSVKGIRSLNNIPRFEVPSIKKNYNAKVMVFPLKEYSYYMDALLGRNIFKAAEKAVQDSGIEGAGIQNMIRGMRLAGISWSEDSAKRYVMIEDMKVNITHYVKEGETILNFTVKKIFKEKVTLSYNGNEVDLR